MPFIQLTSGAYQTRSLIAAAQRCVNLYCESTPPNAGEQMAFAHNCTPGKTILATSPGAVSIRGLYTASNGDLYAVANSDLYYIDSNWTWYAMGHMYGSAPIDAAPRFNPVSMVDNGLSLVLVDGSQDGWTLTLITCSVIQGKTTAICSSTSNLTVGMALSGFNIPAGTTLTAITTTGFTMSQPATGAITNGTLRCGFARINSLNQTVTGTVTSATVIPKSTVIIDTVTVTMGATDTTIADVVTDINNAAIPNIVAYQATSGALTIKDTSGTAIIIGPGTANAVLGISDGSYGVPDAGGFYGADRVDFTDTYLIFNKPGTPVFYVSESESTNCDSLDFASKAAKSDILVSLIVSHRIIALFGQQTIELWYNSGGGGSGALSGNTFPFEAFPNTLLQHGLVAKYSLAQCDGVIYFLSADVTGQGIVMILAGSQVIRISTHAIEAQLSTYPTITDAIGTIYTQQGHTFYMLSFGQGDATWCYDAATKEWHERAWMDSNGYLHRDRVNYTTFAYGTVVGSDWENGNLFALDLSNFTDNGMPIQRIRSFPHQIDMEANRRVSYKQFIANMQVGTSASGASGEQIFVETSFNAPDGTLLENYTGSGDIGSVYTLIQGSGEIMNDGLIGIGPGNVEYLAGGVPPVPDYTLTYNAVITGYSTVPTSTVYVIGRAVANNGYKLAVLGETGANSYSVTLSVMNTGISETLVMGLVTSGNFICKLAMLGSSISVTVQRTQDGFYLQPSATWNASQAVCINISDTTYTAPGRVLIGGYWS